MIKSTKTKVGDWVFVIFCLIVSAICILPMLNLAARSLSSSQYLVRHDVWLWPKGWDFSAYKNVLGNPVYIRSLAWTAFLTVVCTFWSLFITTICAYPLIFPKLRGRSGINIIITITMSFNAGTIPIYLLLNKLGMIDNPLALIIPSCLSVYNMIIMRSFFYGIPDSLRESAEIDGANYFTILGRIYIPLSKPVLATLALFYAVGRWNGYSDALLYLTSKKKNLFPLQLLLYNELKSISSDISVQDNMATPGLSDQLKAATVMFSTVPILLIYPFLQKYFIHGVTLGAVKE